MGVRITGHRGAAGLAPENTLASIELALSLGVDRIEIDVQQTLDHQVVVLHDKSIRRTTTGHGYVKRMTYEELTQFSAGSKFNSIYQNEKVPLLDQVLQLINGRVPLLIEVKYSFRYYPNIERHIINCIKRNDAQEWTKVISFNDLVLKRINKISPETRLGKLFTRRYAKLPLAWDNSVNIKPLRRYHFVDEIIVQYKYATKSIVQKVHDFGKPLSVWTVNDPSKIPQLIENGVDDIITDFPNLMLKYKK